MHRDDCRNLKALKKAPERFTDVNWDGDNEASYRVELQVDAWDRTRLLEDLSRTFAEAGVNILEARCTTKHPMVKNRFVVEVGDADALKQCVTRLRNIDSVFDAYRVTPERLDATGGRVSGVGDGTRDRVCGRSAGLRRLAHGRRRRELRRP